MQKNTPLSCNLTTTKAAHSYAIIDAYAIITEYLQCDEPENEERFIEMENAIEKLKIAFPDSLYKQLQTFIKTHFEPMVYNYRSVFQEEFTEEFGAWGENGTFIIKVPEKENFIKMLVIHIKKITEIREQFEDFAIEYMQPYIL